MKNKVLFLYNDEDSSNVKTKVIGKLHSADYDLLTWENIKERVMKSSENMLRDFVENEGFKVMVFFIGEKKPHPTLSGLLRQLSPRIPYILAIISGKDFISVPISLQRASSEYIDFRTNEQDALKQLEEEIARKMRP
jgi:hypothetical protein